MIDRYHKYVGQTVEMIYIDQKQQISSRTIRVVSAQGDYVRAYCYKQRAPRIFMKSRVLAMMPHAKFTSSNFTPSNFTSSSFNKSPA